MIVKLLLGVKRFKIRKIFNKRFCKEKELKLHLGCGTVYKTGWINIDNNSDNNIKHLDINWDLSKGIPFADNSIDYIFNEHFLEHLTVKEGQVFLKDCKRVLKKNGVMRIAMPDLERIMNDYFNPNWKEDAQKTFDKFNLNYIKTKAERVNIAFRSWGHKWLYDKEELERRLREAGFSNIKICKIYESEHKQLQNLETRNESLLVAEAMK